MWGPSGLIVVIIIIDSVASFQSQCVQNYLCEEEDEVGVVIYLGEGGENVNVFEGLVNDLKVTWTVINRHADAANIVGTPANYLLVAQGLDPVHITRNALYRLSTFHKIWEPSARMIVLLGPPDSSSSLAVSTYKSMASQIISHMWKYSVFDAVVMFLADDVQSGVRLFSANPFARENHCGRFAEKLITLGCEDKTEYFEAERYVWRHPVEYPNCTFKVSRRESPPFSFLSQSGTWEGADIRFVELLGVRKNFKVIWSQRPAPESGSAADEVHQYYKNLTRNGIDLAIGGIAMINKQVYNVSYLRPHSQVSLMYYVADSGNMKSWDTLHAMFTGTVWYILGVSLLLGGVCYSTVVEGRFNIKRTKFLQLLAILVTQTIVLPKRWRVRMFLVVFLFPLYQISTLHSTALQSYMVHTPKEKPISTEYDLRTLNMTVYVSEATLELIKPYEEEMNRTESKVHENLRISHKRLFDRLVTLNRKRNYSILARSLEVDFWRNTEHFEIHPIRPSISTYAVSLAMAKGSPYKDVVDNLTQQCLEAGLFEKWVKDLTSIHRIKPKQALYDSNALEALDMEDLECAFMLLFAGLAMSTVVFLGELYVHKFGTKIKEFHKTKSIDQVENRFKYYVFYRKGMY